VIAALTDDTVGKHSKLNVGNEVYLIEREFRDTCMMSNLQVVCTVPWWYYVVHLDLSKATRAVMMRERRKYKIKRHR